VAKSDSIATAPLETQETVVFKHAGALALQADIYYPPTLEPPGSKARPVGEARC
jgi:hypothetical protein